MKTYIFTDGSFLEDFSFGMLDGGHIHSKFGPQVLEYCDPLYYCNRSQIATCNHNTICDWLLEHGKFNERPGLRCGDNGGMITAHSSRIVQSLCLSCRDFPLLPDNPILDLRSIAGNFQIEADWKGLEKVLDAHNAAEWTSLEQNGTIFKIYNAEMRNMADKIEAIDTLIWDSSGCVPGDMLDGRRATAKLSLFRNFGGSKNQHDCYARFVIRHMKDEEVPYLDGFLLVESVNCMEYPFLQFEFITVLTYLGYLLCAKPGIFITDILDCWFPNVYESVFSELRERVAVPFDASIKISIFDDCLSFISLSLLGCRLLYPGEHRDMDINLPSSNLADFDFCGYPASEIEKYTGDLRFEPIVPIEPVKGSVLLFIKIVVVMTATVFI